MYTSGALILTDDGDFIYKITHPKHEITKTYNVTIRGEISKEEIEKLKNGVEIDGITTSKANAKILKYDPETKKTRIEITIHEGRNRQVRRMLESLNKKVLALHRTRIGDIELGVLRVGEWRHLTPKEVESLMRQKIPKKPL